MNNTIKMSLYDMDTNLKNYSPVNNKMVMIVNASIELRLYGPDTTTVPNKNVNVGLSSKTTKQGCKCIR